MYLMLHLNIKKKTILHGWPGVLFKECLQLDLLQVLLCLDDGGDG